jgi:hypothetical protein
MHMWVKSAQVLGLLLPCLVMRLALACVPLAGTGVVAPPLPPYASAFFIGAGLAGATTVRHHGDVVSQGAHSRHRADRCWRVGVSAFQCLWACTW